MPRSLRSIYADGPDHRVAVALRMRYLATAVDTACGATCRRRSPRHGVVCRKAARQKGSDELSAGSCGNDGGTTCRVDEPDAEVHRGPGRDGGGDALRGRIRGLLRYVDEFRNCRGREDPEDHDHHDEFDQGKTRFESFHLLSPALKLSKGTIIHLQKILRFRDLFHRCW